MKKSTSRRRVAARAALVLGVLAGSMSLVNPAQAAGNCNPTVSMSRGSYGLEFLHYARCNVVPAPGYASVTIETSLTRNGVVVVGLQRQTYKWTRGGNLPGIGTAAGDPAGIQRFCAYTNVTYVYAGVNGGAASTISTAPCFSS